MHTVTDRLDTFLKFLHLALEEQKPLALQNCVVRSEFLHLLRDEALHAFQDLLDTSPHAAYLDADVVHKWHAEMVYRELVRVPRTLDRLRSLLQTHYPTDELTLALDHLADLLNAEADWFQQETTWLTELRRLRATDSCFADVLARNLNIFAPAPGQNRASTQVLFVRRQDPADVLADTYLRPAIVRRMSTVGEPAGERILMTNSGFGAEFETTARAVQHDLRSRHVLSHYLQYQFSDRLLYWDEFHGEGRSAGLAFAYLALVYTHPEYRPLSPYVACLGTYEDEIVQPRVEHLSAKVAAAKAGGVRIFIVPEAIAADEQVDWQGCEVLTYRSGPIGEVLSQITPKLAGLVDADLPADSPPAVAPPALRHLLHADSTEQRDITGLVVPTAWVLYLVVVCEILFMASPFALYYYGTYGPSLNWLHHSAWTAWLTMFFLPHFSYTSNAFLNHLHDLGGILVSSGIVLFIIAFVHLYGVKLWRRRAVTGGLYAVVRHPQYLALAVVGLGTLLLWPRFLVLIMYVTMLFVYTALARWEEWRCEQRFGEPYRHYRERTGRRVLNRLWKKLGSLLPVTGRPRLYAIAAIYVGVVLLTLALAHQLRDQTMAHLSGLYTDRMAVLSPAVLSDTELHTALRIAQAEPEVQQRLQAIGQNTRLLVYVIPVEWELPDLPLALPSTRSPGRRGHYTPQDFDRRLYKVLFTKVRSHARLPRGKAIVTTAYGRDPIIVARVNIETETRLGIDIPPPYVKWGDIPTPLF